MERQLVDAAFETISHDERRIRAALCVGRCRGDTLSLGASNDPDLHNDAGCRKPSRHVEDVSREMPHSYRVSVKPRTPKGAAGSTYTPHSSPRSSTTSHVRLVASNRSSLISAMSAKIFVPIL